jgi:hypothetical protein
MLQKNWKLLVALLSIVEMQRRFVGAFAPKYWTLSLKHSTPAFYPTARGISSETGERTEEEQEAIKAAREAKK